MKQVIALAGPPHCGKDTIADILQIYLPATKVPVAMPMRLAGFALLNEEYSDELYAELKETQLEEFGGMNFREWMIDFSENYMKPKFGKEVFGTLAVRAISNQLFGTVVLSDSGFFEEQMEVVNYVGRDKYLYVRIERDGTDWSKDSRRYTNFVDPQIQTMTVRNEEDMSTIAAEQIINHCLSLGWTF
jgi:hypothetical protein